MLWCPLQSLSCLRKSKSFIFVLVLPKTSGDAIGEILVKTVDQLVIAFFFKKLLNGILKAEFALEACSPEPGGSV